MEALISHLKLEIEKLRRQVHGPRSEHERGPATKLMHW
jgi:hypothetical protein